MKILYLILLFVSVTGHAQTVDSYLSTLEALRVEVDSNIERTPYQKAQQDTFKTYFGSFGSLIEDLDSNDRMLKRYHYLFKSQGPNGFCKTVFLDKARWNELVKKCTKNRFFLCAEEVRVYSSYKEALKERLTTELKEEFEKEPLCKI